MIKLFSRLIRLGLFLAVAGLIFHNLTARTVLSWGLSHRLGVPVETGSASVDFWSTKVFFREVIIRNAESFGEGYVMKIPYLTLDFDLGAFFDGRLRLESVEADIGDFQIVRAPDGRINWLDLKPVQEASRSKSSGGEIRKNVRVEHFVLTVRRGTYIDLSKPPGSDKVMALDIDHRDYLGVHAVEDMVKLVSYEVFKRMGLSALGTGILDQVRADLEGSEGFRGPR